MEKLEQLKEAHEYLEKALNLMRNSSHQWHIERLLGCRKLLLDKYAPFKVGDRVCLLKTPTITLETSWGWYHSRHFLIKGAKGYAREVDVSINGFSAGVEFDEESWIDSDGKIRPVERKHLYHFNELWLVKV